MITFIYSKYIEHFKISTDTRNIAPNSIFFALKGANFNANQFAIQALEKGAAYAIVDEKKYKINDKIILVDNTLTTLQELAKFHRKKLDIKIIALTGSNGKTTTKELINAVLSKKYNTTATLGNLNNHIGVPLTLLSMTNKTEIGIVEMGANHPKEIEFLCNIIKPNYGYITNFGKAHLEGFGSIDGVIKAKTELYQYLKTNKQAAFINLNDPIQINKSKDIKTISFGTKQSEIPIEYVSADPNVNLIFDDTKIKSNLIGDYNYNNIAAAIAIGKYFKINNELIKNAIEAYNPTNNRSQIINIDNKKIILDAYNANPSSMISALNNMIQLKAKNKIIILGDMFELGNYAKAEHQKITDFVSKQQFSKIYLIGNNFSQTKSSQTNMVFFNDYSNFKIKFKTTDFNNSTILIKGSRGMALERIVNLF